jgi:hypothetical protein
MSDVRLIRIVRAAPEDELQQVVLAIEPGEFMDALYDVAADPVEVFVCVRCGNACHAHPTVEMICPGSEDTPSAGFCSWRRHLAVPAE